VVAQRVDCYTTDLRVFTGSIISGDHALNFVAKSLVERLLASNRGPPGRFGSTPGFENFASPLRLEATKLRSAFALSQRSAQSSLKRL
jgi:hypothetical protein